MEQPKATSHQLPFGEVLHFCLLVTVPVLYATLVSLAGDGDSATRSVRVAAEVGSVAWAAIVVAFAIRTTTTSSDVKLRLASTYRSLLSHKAVLITLNTFLAILSVALIDQLAFYRPVHIRSTVDVYLYANDGPGDLKYLAYASANREITLRLRTGTRRIAYKSVDGRVVGALKPISVAISTWDNGFYNLDPTDEQKFETFK